MIPDRTRIRRRADAGSFHEDALRTTVENSESSGSSRGAGRLRGAVASQLCLRCHAAVNEAFDLFNPQPEAQVSNDH